MTPYFYGKIIWRFTKIYYFCVKKFLMTITSVILYFLNKVEVFIIFTKPSADRNTINYKKMNQNFTLAKFLAFFSLILIITFNTQAQNALDQPSLIISANELINNSLQKEISSKLTLEVKENTVFSLPVKYLSFEGKMIKNSLVLNWVTLEEVNHNYFQIERSFNGSDFTQIGLALDGFENGTKKEYAFKDYSNEAKNKKIIYYRLKQIDYDGNYTFSENLLVNLK